MSKLNIVEVIAMKRDIGLIANHVIVESRNIVRENVFHSGEIVLFVGDRIQHIVGRRLDVKHPFSEQARTFGLPSFQQCTDHESCLWPKKSASQHESQQLLSEKGTLAVVVGRNTSRRGPIISTSQEPHACSTDSRHATQCSVISVAVDLLAFSKRDDMTLISVASRHASFDPSIA